MCAASNYDLVEYLGQIVQAMINSEADVHAVDYSGSTALIG